MQWCPESRILSGKCRKTKKPCPNMAVEPPSPLKSSMELTVMMNWHPLHQRNKQRQSTSHCQPSNSLKMLWRTLRNCSDLQRLISTRNTETLALTQRQLGAYRQWSFFASMCLSLRKPKHQKKSLGGSGWRHQSLQQGALDTQQKIQANLGKRKPRRKWLWAFIDDHEEVARCNWSMSGRSLIDNEDFVQEVHVHLQMLGPYISAQAIIQFIDSPEMLDWLHQKKTIPIATAQCWMKKMDYQWTINSKGQYVNGHECEDVVNYWNNVFLPSMVKLKKKTQEFGSRDMPNSLPSGIQHVVVWYHDESTFYANDRRQTCWVHKSETAKPYAKGRGILIMITFSSTWLWGWN